MNSNLAGMSVSKLMFSPSRPADLKRDSLWDRVTPLVVMVTELIPGMDESDPVAEIKSMYSLVVMVTVNIHIKLTYIQ